MKTCANCKYYEKPLADYPCSECLITRNIPHWVGVVKANKVPINNYYSYHFKKCAKNGLNLWAPNMFTKLISDVEEI